MLLSLAIWVQNTEFFTFLRSSPSYVYPVILSLHMVTLAFFGGTILMTDMRLLGWAMPSRSVSDVIDQLRWPKRIGFLFMATFGLLLLCTKAEIYYYNPFFRIKLLLFALIAVHALIFRGSVYNRAAELDRAPQMPGRAKLAASLSLILWVCVFSAGRAIGYLWAPSGLHLKTYFP